MLNIKRITVVKDYIYEKENITIKHNAQLLLAVVYVSRSAVAG